ncbi:MAG: tRNA (adenosine(37)-N6)-dimethylallyltransferase MiaA [Acidobacteria bacterium]|nr:tRNA (adenosine(37)-N6)-dimethylallyltransferase MiaA [Acidobacteriota bacterium]
MVTPRFVAVLGPTATGKSALGLAIARRYGGEIVNCDSTAVYRGFDIGTDKVPPAQQHGIPHHLIDIVDPTDEYTAARFVHDASTVVRDIHARGRLPIVVGGTGLYFRALTRGLFPGPPADPALRARLERVAARRGNAWLHRLLVRRDPASAARIASADRKRMIRAIEVLILTGRPLTAHFAETVAPLPEFDAVAIGLRMTLEALAPRLARRVDEQFAAGLVAEVRGLLARGVPREARPFGGLVYRQMLDELDGVRGREATRALIVQENRRYARRQLIWFRKEPTLRWFDGPGEAAHVQARVFEYLGSRGLHDDGSDVSNG